MALYSKYVNMQSLACSHGNHGEGDMQRVSSLQQEVQTRDLGSNAFGLLAWSSGSGIWGEGGCCCNIYIYGLVSKIRGGFYLPRVS